MRQHKIEFTISIETRELTHEEYLEILEPFHEKIVNNQMQKMTFDELIKALELNKRDFLVTQMGYPELSKYDYLWDIKTTKINIEG